MLLVNLSLIFRATPMHSDYIIFKSFISKALNIVKIRREALIMQLMYVVSDNDGIINQELNMRVLEET